jgi:hypothetical protein
MGGYLEGRGQIAGDPDLISEVKYKVFIYHLWGINQVRYLQVFYLTRPNLSNH